MEVLRKTTKNYLQRDAMVNYKGRGEVPNLAFFPTEHEGSHKNPQTVFHMLPVLGREPG